MDRKVITSNQTSGGVKIMKLTIKTNVIGGVKKMVESLEKKRRILDVLFAKRSSAPIAFTNI